MPDSIAAIALGSNLGDRASHLTDAVERIRLLGRVTGVSSSYDTAPVGYLAQPNFLNAALLLETQLAPEELLERLLAIERAMGRDRAFVPAKGPRVIDLDLILYDDRIVAMRALVLPHPAFHERAFVLDPLCELAPDWVHPVLGRTVQQLRQDLADYQV